MHEGTPEPPVHGVIRSLHTNPQAGGIGWTTFGGDQPVYIGPGNGEWLEWRVWRDGAKVRVETGAGAPRAICGGTTLWAIRAGAAKSGQILPERCMLPLPCCVRPAFTNFTRCVWSIE